MTHHDQVWIIPGMHDLILENQAMQFTALKNKRKKLYDHLNTCKKKALSIPSWFKKNKSK